MRLVFPSPKLPRRHLLILPSLLLLASIHLYLHTPKELANFSNFKDASQISWFHHRSKLWHSFAPVLAATEPRCSPPTSVKDGYRSPDMLNETYDFFNISTAEVACIHRSHALFVDLVNFGTPRLDFEKKTHGFATLTSKSDFSVLLVNIFMLRRTGSTLPVEVFLETEDDYEANLCEVVLPGLNATCIILSSLLESSNHLFKIPRTRMWIFALLFSSFEAVLFLGAGSFLLHSPDELFNSEPFTTNGLVLWPSIDDLSFSQQIPELVGLEEDLLPGLISIDHRQIMVMKKYHVGVLLMAAYYSVYSTYYDPLIGEHHILSLAAAVMKKPLYVTNHPPRRLGDNISTSAVVQFAPTTDLNCGEQCNPQAMLVHTNWLSTVPGLLTSTESMNERVWGTKEMSQDIAGEDIEARAWSSVTSVLCRQDLASFTWESCHAARMRLSRLLSSSEAPPGESIGT